MSDHITWLPVSAGGRVLHGTVYSEHFKRRVAACTPAQDLHFLDKPRADWAYAKCLRCQAVFKAYPEMENPEPSP